MAPALVCANKVGLPSSGGHCDSVSRSPLHSYSLEHHLAHSLRITNDKSVKKCDCFHKKRSVRIGRFTLSETKVIMGLVVEQERRESDSPSLPDCMSCPPSSGASGHKDSLVSLALRTMILLQRNRLLQERLSALQVETRALVKSMLPQPPDS